VSLAEVRERVGGAPQLVAPVDHRADRPGLEQFTQEHQHMEPGEEHENAFEFGLDLVLDGLERLRDSR